jgi:hypothetical protein
MDELINDFNPMKYWCVFLLEMDNTANIPRDNDLGARLFASSI